MITVIENPPLLSYLDTLSHCICVMAIEQSAKERNRRALAFGAEQMANLMVEMVMEHLAERTKIEKQLTVVEEEEVEEDEEQKEAKIQSDNWAEAEDKKAMVQEFVTRLKKY